MIYNLCLAITDSAFNRMIRGKVSHWERAKEWEWITITFNAGCLFIPYLFLVIISPYFASVFIIVSCFCFWDLIFGRLVGGKWTSDHPAGKILGIWIMVDLWVIIVLRCLFGVISLIFLLMTPISIITGEFIVLSFLIPFSVSGLFIVTYIKLKRKPKFSSPIK